MSQVQVNTLIQMWRAKMVQQGKIRIIKRAKEVRTRSYGQLAS